MPRKKVDTTTVAPAKVRRPRKLKEPKEPVLETVTITVEVSREVFDFAQRELKITGAKVEDYICMKLRALATARDCVFDIHDKMPFGKYRGEIIDTVMRVDPQYLNWLNTVSERFFLKPNAEQLLAVVLAIDDNRDGARMADALGFDGL